MARRHFEAIKRLHYSEAAFERHRHFKERNESELLPQCFGPKLGPFKDRSSSVQFCAVENSGRHGRVFRVIIASHTYAMKVVRVL